MSLDEDPEVVADLRLRAYTEHDRSRGREMPVYTPPKIFGQWRCKTPGCGAMVDVTEDTFERWGVFNGILRSKADAPLDTAQIVYCPSCTELYKAAQSKKRRAEVDRMAVVIRGVKEGKYPLRVDWNGTTHELSEAQAYEKLAKWGHPDVEGLRQCLLDKAMASSGKRSRKVGA